MADTVRVYDYVSKTPMCQAKYNSGGSSLLWVPKDVSVKLTQPEDWGEEGEVESHTCLGEASRDSCCCCVV